jgi:molybdopterin/thiamine biosynthesis adenylyltransferase
VESSNLHRQIIHTEASEGLSKAQSARRAGVYSCLTNHQPNNTNAALALNSHIECIAVEERFSAANAMELVK